MRDTPNKPLAISSYITISNFTGMTLIIKGPVGDAVIRKEFVRCKEVIPGSENAKSLGCLCHGENQINPFCPVHLIVVENATPTAQPD